MDAKQKLEERQQMFANAFAFKHNDHVPQLSNFFTWQIFDCGYDLNALYDYEVMEKIDDEFNERYQFDCYIDLLTRNPLRATRPFGGTHVISMGGDALEVRDHIMMEPDEYREFIDNPEAEWWTNVFRRYCGDNATMGNLTESLQEFIRFGTFAGKMMSKCATGYGALNYYSSLFIVPFEFLFNYLRGIKGTSLDMRKIDKGLMKEWMDFFHEAYTIPNVNAALGRGIQPGFAATISTGFLAHTLLSTRQFGEIYWPYLEPTVDRCAETGATMTIMCEDTMLRFAEYFEDVPRGTLMVLLERDDPFEFRKRLPNIAIAGGMPAMLLGRGTKQECIDYAKHLIDDLGDGFVLSQNKMMSFRNDCTRENLLAVTEFVREYTA